MGKIKNKNEEKVVKTENNFTKEQLVSSKKYSSNKDILQSQLEDGKLYTAKEADEKIEKFKKGKVK